VKRGVKILVVDDEATLRNAMQQLLEHAGHSVVAADSGEAALALLAQGPFDVVMTDFSMPGMKGDELIARIREAAPHQRIILATAFVDEYKVFGQPAATADALLLKPFSLTDLYEAIALVLELEPESPTDALPPIIDSLREQDFRPPTPPP
jgi:CheY-like chemotaxis protein